MTHRKVLFVGGPLLFLLSFFLPVDRQTAATLGTILWMGSWWVGEVVPLAVTSLLPLVLAPIFGVSPAEEIAPFYAKSPIFLFLGGFMLAIALEKYNIHKYLSAKILSLFGNSQIGVFVGISLASYFLSMWISNTSATLIMVPLILSLKAGSLTVALALGAAFSANIGGIATLIGTPPNIIYAGVLRSYGQDISFMDWMRFGFPYSALLEILFLIVGILWFRLGRKEVELKFEEVELTSKGKIVLSIFLLAVLLWLTRTGLSVGFFSLPGWKDLLGLKGVDDATVAMAVAITLFLFGLIDWEDTKKVPWGALLIFGGGFALSHMMVKSGLSKLLTASLSTYSHFPPIFFVAVWAALILLITEVASNTSVSAVFVPLVYSFALGVHLNPKALAAVVTVASSGAFMLPVATPPNMLVYSFNLVRLDEMVKVGAIMNAIALIMVVSLVYHLAP